MKPLLAGNAHAASRDDALTLEKAAEERFDAFPEDGKDERAGVQLGRGLSGFFRGAGRFFPAEPGLEISREAFRHAPRDVAQEIRAAELGERAGQGEPDFELYARRRAALFLVQSIVDFSARRRARARVLRAAADGAGIGGRIPHDVGGTVEFSDDGSGAHPHARLDMVCGRRAGERRAGEAGRDLARPAEKFPYFVARKSDGE